MDDTVRVAVLNGVDDLDEDLASFLLRQEPLLLHILHQFAATGQLHYHYELLSFDEGVVELNNVLVSKLLDAVSLLIDSVNFVGAMH